MYHLNKMEGGGFASGVAARKTPIFPRLLRRYGLIIKHQRR
jgi:hypothetical protein